VRHRGQVVVARLRLQLSHGTLQLRVDPLPQASVVEEVLAGRADNRLLVFEIVATDHALVYLICRLAHTFVHFVFHVAQQGRDFGYDYAFRSCLLPQLQDLVLNLQNVALAGYMPDHTTDQNKHDEESEADEGVPCHFALILIFWLFRRFHGFDLGLGICLCQWQSE